METYVRCINWNRLDELAPEPNQSTGRGSLVCGLNADLKRKKVQNVKHSTWKWCWGGETFLSFYMIMKHRSFIDCDTQLWTRTENLWCDYDNNQMSKRTGTSRAELESRTGCYLKKKKKKKAMNEFKLFATHLIKSWRNNKKLRAGIVLVRKEGFPGKPSSSFFLGGLGNIGKVCSSCGDHRLPLGKTQNRLFLS